MAQDEARIGGFGAIHSDHLLAGLLREEEGFAAHVLNELDITLDAVRKHIEKVDDVVQIGQLPFTAGAKKALELALREALSLGHNYIGTEHILLGLLRIECTAKRLLAEHFDAPEDKVRGLVIRMLSGPGRKIQRTAEEKAKVETEEMDNRLRELGEVYLRGVSQGRRELTLDEYQGQAHATAVYPPEVALIYVSLKLAGEAGEIAEKIGKWLRDRTLEYVWNDEQGMPELIQADPDVDVRELLMFEAGDLLWYVQELVGILGYELSEVGQANLDKLASRAKRGVLKGSGDER